MKFLVAISIAALASATAGYAAPQADQAQVSQFACDLGGDCGDVATPAAGQSDAATPAGTPRSSSVRGFTFKRTASSIATDTPVSAPSPVAPAAVTAPRPVAPPHSGAANLRLDFASGSADLDSGDRTRLAALSEALSGPRLVGRRVRIEGHTDSRGSSSKNLDLSRRRAQSVADYLVSTGVDRARLDVIGYGSTQPLPGHAASDGANRRVMAVMLN